MDLRITKLLVGKENIFRREQLAVMPADSSSQMKNNDQPIGFYVPGFGEIADQLQIFIVFDQAIKDEACDVIGSRIGN